MRRHAGRPYRSLAAGPGSSAGWGTVAGSRSAAALSPAGTQSVADCTGSFLRKRGAQSHFGAVHRAPCHPQESHGILAPCLQRQCVSTMAQISYYIFVFLEDTNEKYLSFQMK